MSSPTRTDLDSEISTVVSGLKLGQTAFKGYTWYIFKRKNKLIGKKMLLFLFHEKKISENI